MKNIFNFLALILLCALTAVSCAPKATEQLLKPVITDVDSDYSSIRISWEAVENADSYVYGVTDGEEKTTSELFGELTDLVKGEYFVRVKAVSSNSKYGDSDWAIQPVTVEEGSNGRLKSPVLTIDNTGDGSFEVSWPAVENADAYVYKLDNKEEANTSDLKVEFENLTDGKHIVRVKATSDDPNYLESLWAEKSVIIGTWLEAEAYLDADPEHNYDNHNSIFADIKSMATTEIRAAILQGTVSATDTDLLNAFSTNNSFRLSAPDLAKANSAAGLTKVFQNAWSHGSQWSETALRRNSNYTLVVYAVNEVGDTDTYVQAISTGAPTFPPNGLASWVGTSWSVISTMSILLNNSNGTLTLTPQNGEIMEFDITVEEYPENIEFVAIRGLSQLGDDYVILAEGDQSKLTLKACTVVGEKDGKPIEMMPIAGYGYTIAALSDYFIYSNARVPFTSSNIFIEFRRGGTSNSPQFVINPPATAAVAAGVEIFGRDSSGNPVSLFESGSYPIRLPAGQFVLEPK